MYSVDEPDKQAVAVRTIDSVDNSAIISLQVINELSNILLKKINLN